MKYDDSTWHSENDFPSDLSPDAAATHIGMYVAWCILSGLGGEIHIVEQTGENSNLEILKEKKLTPGQFLIKYCDGKFTNDDLSDEGEQFTKAYYEKDNYLDDYEDILGAKVESLYHVKDNWNNFELLKLILDKRLKDWRDNLL